MRPWAGRERGGPASGSGSHSGTTGASRQKPFLIGLTGPIGCGKSAVARMLVELGGTLIDADILARDITARGEPSLPAIRQRFGASVFHPDGSLDRTHLGRIVFSDPKALADLEEITHPHVRRRVASVLDRAAAAGDPFVVLEAIKLVEGGLAEDCDEVWLVECSAAEQRQRMLDRGMTPDDIARRTATQGADMVERLAPYASRRILTSGTLAETRERVEDALAEALAPVLLDD
jgi:dephospho-CoA kinase